MIRRLDPHNHAVTELVGDGRPTPFRQPLSDDTSHDTQLRLGRHCRGERKLTNEGRRQSFGAETICRVKIFDLGQCEAAEQLNVAVEPGQRQPASGNGLASTRDEKAARGRKLRPARLIPTTLTTTCAARVASVSGGTVEKADCTIWA